MTLYCIIKYNIREVMKEEENNQRNECSTMETKCERCNGTNHDDYLYRTGH